MISIDANFPIDETLPCGFQATNTINICTPQNESAHDTIFSTLNVL